MVDVDDFKSINDRFGHLVGDKALISVSNILKSSCNQKDFIGRFSRDEFIIIDHTSDKNDIESLIRNINKNISPFKNTSLQYSLSLSIGYEVYNRNDNVSIDKIISTADRVMYKMKSKKERLQHR